MWPDVVVVSYSVLLHVNIITYLNNDGRKYNIKIAILIVRMFTFVNK